MEWVDDCIIYGYGIACGWKYLENEKKIKKK